MRSDILMIFESHLWASQDYLHCVLTCLEALYSLINFVWFRHCADDIASICVLISFHHSKLRHTGVHKNVRNENAVYIHA